MDVLKNKNYKQHKALSRYSTFPYYYNTLDNKYIYGVTSQLNTDMTHVLHKVNKTDTLEALSLNYYGRPDYWWIIADFNNIVDPYISLSDKFKTLKIPPITNISFKRV